MRLHTGFLPYKCSKCDQKFRTPAGRKLHIDAHQKVDLYLTVYRVVQGVKKKTLEIK